jgi:hypothetical protein
MRFDGPKTTFYDAPEYIPEAPRIARSPLKEESFDL